MSPPHLHLVPNKVIKEDSPCFIIAEIGQNHQGSSKIAKTLIDAAKASGADCVKFQKTHITSKFTRSATDRPYSSQHSWGRTYGEHKKHLEFTDEEFKELQKYAKDVGIPFTASAMDLVSLEFLYKLDVPFIKIGSGDNTNYELISRASELGKPIVLSTGMLTDAGVHTVYELLKRKSTPFAMMHCVSGYPVPYHQVNLRNISAMSTSYPDVHIGYSGHELGIEITIAAVALGAKIVERHFTLDKTLKGTDHACSLEPSEFADMVRSIRRVEIAFGSPTKSMQPCELACFKKLGKSVVTTRRLSKGHIVTDDDVCIKVSEPKGVSAGEIETVIGHMLLVDKLEDEPIFETDVGSL